MANHRMVCTSFLMKSEMLELPKAARLLYYDLIVNADDDGIVEAAKVLKITSSPKKNLMLLVSSGYVEILNDRLIVYLPHWLKHNHIRKDRYTPSEYHDLLVARMETTADNSSVLHDEADTAATMCQPVDNQRSAQDKAGEDMDDLCGMWNPQFDFLLSGPDMEAPSPAQQATEQKKETADSVIMEMVCAGGKTYRITESKIAQWAETYPGVDILYQLRRANQWLIDNPTRRKTAKGIPRFINNWLDREQNAGYRAGQAAVSSAQKERRKLI